MAKAKALTAAAAPAPSTSRALAQGLASHPAVATAIDIIAAAAGGRDQLVAKMIAAPLTEEAAFIIGAIADPSGDGEKLSTTCRRMGLSMDDVIRTLRKGIYAEATIKSMIIIAERTPGVIEDVMVRAAPHEIVCDACRGVGTCTSPDQSPDAAPTMCTSCRGTGRELILPEVDRQKLALSLGPMIPKGAPLVNVDARSVTMSDHSPEGFAKMLAATDRILHGKRVTPVTIDVAAQPEDPSDGD